MKIRERVEHQLKQECKNLRARKEKGKGIKEIGNQEKEQ